MSDKEMREIFKKGLFKGEIKFDEPMSAYTSLKIGGPVDIMVLPEDPASLKNVLTAARMEGIPYFVLGAGTNLLVKDGGVSGIAISLKAFRNFELIRNLEKTEPDIALSGRAESFVGLFVEAGVMLGGLISFTKGSGYSGLEALAGIPGTFGGALYMNAGSFGAEIKDVVVSIALMKMDGEIIILKGQELKFFYRGIDIPDDAVILSANIILKKDTPGNVSERVSRFLKKKKQSQPMGRPSAGCVFKNPEDDSAGRLMDEAGCKEMKEGEVEVSPVHANYFINKGRATCKDYVELMEKVKAKVKKKSGITLEPEIRIIGRD